MARTVRKKDRRRHRQTKRKNQRGGISIKSFGAPWRGIKRTVRKLKQNRKYNDNDKKTMVDKFDELENLECLKEYLGDKLFRKYKSIKKYQDEGGSFTEGRKIKFIEDFYKRKLGPLAGLTEEKKEELLKTFDKLKGVKGLKEKLGNFYEEYENLKAAEGDDIECKKAIFIEKLPNILFSNPCPQEGKCGENAECQVEDEINYKCVCKEGFSSPLEGSNKLNTKIEGCSQNTDKVNCDKTYKKEEREDLEKKIKIAEKKITEKIKEIDSAEEGKTFIGKIDNFLNGVKNNVELSKFKRNLKSLDQETLKLYSEIAAECGKANIVEELVDNFKNQEELFNNFKKLEEEQIRQDFESGLFNPEEGESQNEMKELSIFIVTDKKGGIDTNEEIGIINKCRDMKTDVTTYKTIHSKTYVRPNYDSKDHILVLPADVSIKTDSIISTDNGDMVKIIKGGPANLPVNPLPKGTDWRNYSNKWVKLVKKNGENNLVLENIKAKSGSEPTTSDVSYKFFSGDIIIIPNSDEAITFDKVGSKIFVTLEGRPKNPIYVKSKIGDDIIHVLSNSKISFEITDQAIESKFMDEFKEKQQMNDILLKINELDISNKKKFILSTKIRIPTIKDLKHTFLNNGDRDEHEQYRGSFYLPFLKILKDDKDEDILVLLEFLLKIINTLRKNILPRIINVVKGNGGEDLTLEDIAKSYHIDPIQLYEENETTLKGLSPIDNPTKIVPAVNAVLKTPSTSPYTMRTVGQDATVYEKISHGRGSSKVPQVELKRATSIFLYYPYITYKNKYILTSTGGWIKYNDISNFNDTIFSEVGSAENDRTLVRKQFQKISDKIGKSVKDSLKDNILDEKKEEEENKRAEIIYRMLGLEKEKDESKSFKTKITDKIEKELLRDRREDDPEFLKNNNLNSDIYFHTITDKKLDYYLLTPACRGVPKSDVSIIDDIAYQKTYGSVRDGKKSLEGDPSGPQYEDPSSVQIHCNPRLLVAGNTQDINEKCGPPFNKTEGVKPVNADGIPGPKVRACLKVNDIMDDDTKKKEAEEKMENKLNYLKQKLRQGYTLKSSIVLPIIREIKFLHWSIHMYKKIRDINKTAEQIAQVNAGTGDNRIEILGIRAEKYACIMDAYHQSKEKDCGKDDVDWLQELNPNEKIFKGGRRVQVPISDQKYMYFGLEENNFNKSDGLVSNLAIRRVGEPDFKFLPIGDMAISIHDTKYGAGANFKTRIVEDLKKYMNSLAGKLILTAGVASGKKALGSLVKKAFMTLVLGPLGLMAGGGGGLKLLTDGKYQKPKRTKRTKKRRKKKITQKPSRKR